MPIILVTYSTIKIIFSKTAERNRLTNTNRESGIEGEGREKESHKYKGKKQRGTLEEHRINSRWHTNVYGIDVKCCGR